MRSGFKKTAHNKSPAGKPALDCRKSLGIVKGAPLDFRSGFDDMRVKTDKSRRLSYFARFAARKCRAFQAKRVSSKKCRRHFFDNLKPGWKAGLKRRYFVLKVSKRLARLQEWLCRKGS